MYHHTLRVIQPKGLPSWLQGVLFGCVLITFLSPQWLPSMPGQIVISVYFLSVRNQIKLHIRHPFYPGLELLCMLTGLIMILRHAPHPLVPALITVIFILSFCQDFRNQVYLLAQFEGVPPWVRAWHLCPSHLLTRTEVDTYWPQSPAWNIAQNYPELAISHKRNWIKLVTHYRLDPEFQDVPLVDCINKANRFL